MMIPASWTPRLIVGGRRPRARARITQRHVTFARCRKCRRITPHEEVIRPSKAPFGLILITMDDCGFHCYNCGHDWGFAFRRAAGPSRPTPWTA